MDRSSKFQVPRIPTVSASSLLQEKNTSKKKRSSKKVLSEAEATAAIAAKKALSKNSSNVVQSSEVKTEVEKSPPMAFLPSEDLLSKLCPSCSSILVQYLSPIESYLRKLITAVDLSASSPSSQQPTLSTFEFTTEVSSAADKQKQSKGSKKGKQESGKHQSSKGTGAGGSKVASKQQKQSTLPSSATTSVQGSNNRNESKSALNVQSSNHQQQQQFTNSNNGGGHENVTITGERAENESSTKEYVSSGSGEHQQQVQHSTASSFYGHDQHKHQHQGSGDSSDHQSTHHHQPNQQHQHQEMASSNDNHHHQQTTNSIAEHQLSSVVQNFDGSSVSQEYHSPTTSGHDGNMNVSVNVDEDHHHQQNEQNVTSEVDSSLETVCPYAYVTLAYDNLSTVNAILLANSIQLFNNQVLSVLEDDFAHGSNGSKRILHQYHIPTVILLCDANINRTLKQLAYQVFDKVIESKYQDAVLLNDESLGIAQYKIHLWKELAYQYEKCIFLESFTMVVGEISDLLLQAEELSASVDCFFPDHFNCSVFVFEPSMDTYKGLLRLGLQLKHNEGEDRREGFGEGGFDADSDTLDEMTLLNQYFAPHWRKLSFVYNFVRNDLTYTQIPAYFKFGDNVRIVNFGSSASAQHSSFSTSNNIATSSSMIEGKNSFFNSPMQPWNYKFDLNKATLEEEPFESAPIDNYSKFYLRCFVRRIWPLLSQTITPYLLSHHNGNTEWTVFDLIAILGRQSGEGIAQNPVTLSRKKSWAIDFHLQQQLALQHQQQQQSASEVDDDDDDGGEEGDDENQETSTVVSGDEDDLEHQQKSDESKRQWEAGRVDWMGEHQSDRIINRLKHLIHQ